MSLTHSVFSAAYISLETVLIEDSGRVMFQPIPEDRELEVVYLAPELQQNGIVTEKVGITSNGVSVPRKYNPFHFV